ncbi:hypothetical protein J3S90_01810 [Flavobacterium sp. P4023]|uniref:Lipoprotein n=1 Tax=Flavobacterium flabelliforme TaxID=2816119 RepID=A0ABS5CPI2_9FLAO|nr:hypothetical protein [Flavobacterium flabelliforme]MBP4140533.1 hypothetical protein [Flavobacterium flabelliforme]
MRKSKPFFSLFIILFFSACQMTETFFLNQDGSGTITTQGLRDESSYMKLVGEDYSKENNFIDSSYVFKEYISKYQENFSKLPLHEKSVFNQYKEVNVHIKKNSFDKEFRTVISCKFDKIEAVPDLYKTEEYADDLRHNYALSAEEHYYKVSYSFDGNVFKRSVTITDVKELKKQQARMIALLKQLGDVKMNQSYVLDYHFPKKIKYVSNTAAIVSNDKLSVSLRFLISDSLQDPESTILEVVLE